MQKQSGHPAEETENAIRAHGDMLFRLCFVSLQSAEDAEDALQETFLRFLSKAPAFHDAEHQKAWLIRVAVNVCKDMHRFRSRHRHLNLDDLRDICVPPENKEALEEVMALPGKFKTVILLHYAEDYDVQSIAMLLGLSVSAVKKRLQRGREMLKLSYEKEGASS